MTPIEFLKTVWGEEEGYVFLPYKGQRWVEAKAFQWPADEGKVEQHIERHGSDKDLYYCPNLFSEPVRNREFVQNPKWLYADLDAVDPRKLSLKPTLAIQSSPGRHQGLWKLSRPIDPAKHEEYNRRLTYATGADKGGWDITQVLRIPETRNHKYSGQIRVRIRWANKDKFNLGHVNRYLKGVESNMENVQVLEATDLLLPAESPNQIRKRYWSGLDHRTRELLTATEIPDNAGGGEGRSGVLWELECRLLEAGLDPEETFVVVRDTVWNKFDGRRDADLQLWREVQKAHLHVGSNVTQTMASDNGRVTRARPRLLSYAELLGSGIREPEWAIEGWWTLGSHGVIAGLPKSFKSLVAFDMAVSLASETPFLGQFDVNPKASGPVLMVQQENSLPMVRDRLLKISNNRGLQIGEASLEGADVVIFQAPPSIPIFFYNDFGFDMTMPDDREAIESVIRSEGIKTVMFDPLYLMIGGADENSAKEIRPVLQWLLRIRNLYNCQVMVIHHWGKGSQSRGGRGVGGTRLLGSTTIYGWLEAALYLEARHTDAGVQVVVEREFRERPSPPPIAFNLTLGEIGKLHYAWTSSGAIGTTNTLIQKIADAGPRGATLAYIRNELDWGQKKARKELDELIEQGMVEERLEGRSKRIYLIGEAQPDVTE